MSDQFWSFAAFNLLVLFMLALDLGVFHRTSHVVSFREALTWTGVWIGLAMLFAAGVFYWKGDEAGKQFLTGYVIEKALSVDNIFVFVLLFGYFQVPTKYQHKVLFWGILSALIMRAIFIWAGVALLEKFHWLIYVFGALLIWSGLKLLWKSDQPADPEQNAILRLCRRWLPISKEPVEDHFTTRIDGKFYFTPLFLVLILIEISDLIFAVDSIPAIMAVTKDPFIIYTSNVLAIMGLRSLYFALAGVMHLFHYLHYGLAAILVFVGVKMLLGHTEYKIDINVSLAVILSILAAAIGASLLFQPKAAAHPQPKSLGH
jgi:tellurite resistance protein TerC